MHLKTSLLFVFLLVVSTLCFAQSPESAPKSASLSGSVSATNNGISLIPLFSLGKPAAIFDMSLSKSHVSFDPELAFSIDGHPWYLLLWVRYKIVSTPKFRLTAGTHLGLNFKEALVGSGRDATPVNVVERYIVGELAPNYLISKNASVGIYYLFSHGLDAGTAKAIHFFTVNANFTHLKLGGDFYLKTLPQLYHLSIDRNNGFYFTDAVTLAKDNFPLSISALVNKAIKTNIAIGDNFTWNMSLTYSLSLCRVSRCARNG
jgi:hypothetical protein